MRPVDPKKNPGHQRCESGSEKKGDAEVPDGGIDDDQCPDTGNQRCDEDHYEKDAA